MKNSNNITKTNDVMLGALVERYESARNHCKSLDEQYQQILEDTRSLEARRDVAEQIKKFYEEKIWELGVDPNGVVDDLISYSKQTTLAFLFELDKPQGLMAREILEEYEKVGIEIHQRIITQHFTALILEGLVCWVNQEAKRGRRYRAVQNDNK